MSFMFVCLYVLLVFVFCCCLFVCVFLLFLAGVLFLLLLFRFLFCFVFFTYFFSSYLFFLFWWYQNPVSYTIVTESLQLLIKSYEKRFSSISQYTMIVFILNYILKLGYTWYLRRIYTYMYIVFLSFG